MVNVTEIIEKAREYSKTKSIATAAEVCNMLTEWADDTLELIKGSPNND